MKKIIAGVDEVGRGSLVGPVYAAAVILNKEINRKILKDSKKLNKIQRETLAKYIKKNSVWALGSASIKAVSYTHPEPTRLGMSSYAVFC